MKSSGEVLPPRMVGTGSERREVAVFAEGGLN